MFLGSWDDLRLSTSPGYPQLTTGMPVGKPTGMETRGSESPVITGLHGSGCMFWVMRVLAASTHETMVIYLLFYYILGTCNFFSLKYLLVSLFLKIAIKYIIYM
jgi:hypothetical protein